MAIKLLTFGLLSLLQIALAQTSGNQNENPPGVCIPSNRVDQYNVYAWADESATCAAQGVANSCCVTAVGDGTIGCPDLTRADINDLINVVNQQLPKGGWTDTSKVGQWTAGYDLFQNTALDTNIQIEYNHALQTTFFPDDNSLVGTGAVGPFYFTAYTGDGATSIYVSRSC